MRTSLLRPKSGIRSTTLRWRSARTDESWVSTMSMFTTMGPTIPYHWWPYGKDHIVLRKDLDCSPCKKGICKTHECMELITTNDFITAVERQIKVLNIFRPDGNSSSITAGIKESPLLG